MGKSTLFNRLAGKRIALVDDMPGVTRDRNYAHFDWLGHEWSLVDTGGYEPDSDDILGEMRLQTEAALAEADAIIFLLDGKDGINPADHEVASVLRKRKRPVFFAVNKVDGKSHEDRLADFYELGVERLFGISAEHGHGLDDLLDAIKEEVPGAPEFDEEEEEEGEVRVAVIGRPNAGKSTLINRLIGEDRHLVHHEPGTTRDAIDSEVILNGKKYLFVDTAGMRKKSRIDTRIERFSVMRSIKSIERCHIVLLVIDAIEGIVDQDAKVAGLSHDRGRAIIIVFNKWDLVEDKEKQRAELDRQLQERLPHVSYAPVLTVSALDGKRVGRLGEMIEKVTVEHNRRVGTGELNRALEKWTGVNPPPSGAKPLKIYYISQTGVRPPSLVFFVNRPENMPEHYKRYLLNQVREDFGFEGTPVKMYIRGKKKGR